MSLISNMESTIRISRFSFGPALAGLAMASCAGTGLAVVGPLGDASGTARALQEGTQLETPVRIDFRWELNEAGSRVQGDGVARVEPPYRARLDLFLDNGEGVISAAIVEDDLRLPSGAPDDILPPVDLMWGTLGVFRPMGGLRLVAGDRLEEQGERLRYRYEDGKELHYDVVGGSLRSLELLEGEAVVEWVRLTADDLTRYPASATYRNLLEFRELKITRTSIVSADAFDPEIWDPR